MHKQIEENETVYNQVKINDRKEAAWQLARTFYHKNNLDVTTFEKHLLVERYVNEMSMAVILLSEEKIKPFEKLEVAMKGLDAFEYGTKSLDFARPTAKQMQEGRKLGLQPKEMLRGYIVVKDSEKLKVKPIDAMGVFSNPDAANVQAQLDGSTHPERKLMPGDRVLYYNSISGYISCQNICQVSEDGNSIFLSDLSNTKQNAKEDFKRQMHLKSKHYPDGTFAMAEGSRLMTNSDDLQKYLEEIDKGKGFIIQDGISNGMGKIFINPVQEVINTAGMCSVKTDESLRFSIAGTESSHVVPGSDGKLYFMKDSSDSNSLIKNLTGFNSMQIEKTLQQDNFIDFFLKNVKESVPENATKDELFTAAINEFKQLSPENKVKISKILVENGATTGSKVGKVLQHLLDLEEKKTPRKKRIEQSSERIGR